MNDLMNLVVVFSAILSAINNFPSAIDKVKHFLHLAKEKIGKLKG